MKASNVMVLLANEPFTSITCLRNVGFTLFHLCVCLIRAYVPIQIEGELCNPGGLSLARRKDRLSFYIFPSFLEAGMW